MIEVENKVEGSRTNDVIQYEHYMLISYPTITNKILTGCDTGAE